MTRLLLLVLTIGSLFLLKPTCAVAAISPPTHLHVSAPASQPSQAQIDAAASEAQSQGRVINITPGGITIPAALQEVASLPVTFRSTIGNWNYDITVLSMSFTPTGSVLSMGCRFYLPGSTTSTSLYFGANDIAVSGMSGFSGDLPILESLLSDAKSNELDDPAGKLGGQTKFVEFPVPAFQGKAWMGLGKDTKLSFSCGEFKKFSLSGFLKVYDLVEREDPAGQSLTDGKPLLFFWGTKDVFDWQDIYFPVTASRGFHSTNADDIGFHPTDKTNAILDLSLYQSPANLPDCGGGSLGDSWQGIQFDAFAIRLPKLFKLRNPHTLMGQGTNLFLSPNGVIGTVTADKVFALEEGYTDEINKFDLSLDQVTANFSCGASANISMSGRFRLGTCGTGAEKAKELYYNVVYTEQDRLYQVLIKESATDRFKNNGLTLSTGSTLSLSIQNESFVFQTALPAKPRLSTPAYNNSICVNYPTTLTVSNCESISSKWSTGEVDKGTVTINPKATTTYKINCFDKYCINEDSDDLTITVYESLPQPTLTTSSLAFCTYQNASLRADQCVGKLEWQTPDNTTFRELSSNQQTAYFPNQAATATFAYTVRCNLNTCLSPEKPLSLTVYPEPKAPSLWSSATNNTIDRNNSVTISGSCSDNNSIVWDNLPQATVKLASSTTYSAYCKNPGTGCQTQSHSSIGINVLYFPPAGPSPVTFGSVGTNYITVNWRDNSDNEDGFWVYRDTSPAFSNSIRVGDVGANSTSFIDYNLTEGATYYYRIISHNRYDNGYSEVASRSTGVTPDKPILTASSTNIERGSSSNVSGYCRLGTLIWVTPSTFSGGSYTQTDATTYTAKCSSGGIESGASYLTVTVFDKPPVVEPPKPPTCNVSNPSLSLNRGSASINSGDKVNITASCSSGSVVWTSPENFKGGEDHPSVSTTYKAKCKLYEGCESGENTQNVSVSGTPPTCNVSNPSLSLNDGPASINSGDKVNITASCSSGSVVWTSPENFKGGEDHPSVSTTYKAKCKLYEGCESGENTQNVSVSGTPPTCNVSNPSLSLNDGPASINSGDKVNITASCSSGSVVWTSPENFKGGEDHPSVSTTYKAKCKLYEGCESGENTQNVSVSGTPPSCNVSNPSLSLNGGSASINSGDKVNITASCSSGSVVWTSPENFKGGEDHPSVSTTYKAKCKLYEGCESGENTQNVSVSGTPPTCNVSNPSLSLNDGPASINSGDKVNITASCSSGSVVWTSPENFKGGEDHPSVSTTYKAKCKLYEGCESGENTQNVSVSGTPPTCNVSNPSLSLNDGPASINSGDKVNITASCSSGSVVWTSPENFKGGEDHPSVSTTYKAKCKLYEGCESGENTQNVSVSGTPPTCNVSNPSLSLNRGSASINSGDKVNITASCSSGSVVWTSPENFKGGEDHPSVSTTYKAKCKLYEGCESGENTQNVSVRVDPTQTETLTYTGKTILCNGESSTSPIFSGCDGGTVRILQATGGDQVTGNVKVNVEYAAICSKGSRGDVSRTSFYISSGSSPSNLIIEEAINGSESTLTASSSGVKSYKWSTGATDASITVSTDNTYSVTAYSEYLQKGCSTSASKSVTIKKPSQEPITPTISSPGTTVCENNDSGLTLSVTNCNGTLSWSTGKTTQSITVYTAGKYTAYCTLGGKTVQSELAISNNVPKIEIMPPAPPTSTRLQIRSIDGCTGGIKWTRMENGRLTTLTSSNPSYIDIRASDYGQYEATCSNECGSSSTTYTVRP